jgi:hypothetical protein
MDTNDEALPQHRLLTIDGHGHLHTPRGAPLDMVADQLYEIVVQWNQGEEGSWVGCLTTAARRTARFTTADLQDPIFQTWLRALPGWEHEKLWQATTSPGSHLVWRRPTTLEIPRP